MCNHSHGVPPRDMMIEVPTGYTNNMAAQLPNPQILSQALNTMSTEHAKLANLPALVSGTTIYTRTGLEARASRIT